jgi:hypothetical protein
VIDRIADGRTDLVFDYLGEGHPATSKDGHGASLIELCAYYGDVSAIKFLLTKANHCNRWGTISDSTPAPSMDTGGSASSSSRTGRT